jgi:hypothetical protein
VKRYHVQEVKTVETLCDVCGAFIGGRIYKCVKCAKDMCQEHRRVLHVEYSDPASTSGNGLSNRTLVLCTECWPAVSKPVLDAVLPEPVDG